jgi:hypothetical protein
MKLNWKWLLAIALATSVASARTITLQQGVDGYTGCTDSYIDDHYSSEKYGNDGNIAAGSMAYDAG